MNNQSQQGGFYQNRQQNYGNQRPMRRPPLDIVIRKFEAIHGQTLNSEKAIIEALLYDNQWHNLKGCLDSGASMTVGSVAAHAKFCISTEMLRNPRNVVLPDNREIPVDQLGMIKLRARFSDGKVKVFPNMRITLVGDPTWNWLLIGWNEPARMNATPDQVLHATATQPTQNTPPQ